MTDDEIIAQLRGLAAAYQAGKMTFDDVTPDVNRLLNQLPEPYFKVGCAEMEFMEVFYDEINARKARGAVITHVCTLCNRPVLCYDCQPDSRFCTCTEPNPVVRLAGGTIQ